MITTYTGLTVELLQATESPTALVALACSITQHTDPETDITPASAELVKYLYTAEHGNPLEHVTYTFLLQGISRNLATQLVRTRSASYTSGSQHYSDYRSMPVSVCPSIADDPEKFRAVSNAVEASVIVYEALVDDLGVPIEDARQILCGGCTVTVLLTINARNLCRFLEQRLCNRNVPEMQVLAEKLLSLATEHFPELFSNVGPQCYTSKCKQGKMACGTPYWKKTV